MVRMALDVPVVRIWQDFPNWQDLSIFPVVLADK
jgi:hypothetical protein